MRTAQLPILRASMVIPPDISTSGGWCPYVIKFKQVNCDCHQMSLAGVSCLMSGVGGVCTVQCMMGTGHMGSPCGQTDRHMTENLTFPQLRLRAVIKRYLV